MNLRMSIVIGVIVTLAALAAWAAALGLTACAAWAGEAPAPGPRVMTKVRVVAPADPGAPGTPRLVRAPLAPMPDEVSARGWFGMQFTCSECTIEPRTASKAPVWTFAEPPEVYRVEPGGPADKGGMLPGDVLTQIDGLALDSAEGGRRFGAVEPGQKVHWTVRRGGATRDLAVVAGERPGQGQVPSREAQLARLNEQLVRAREMLVRTRDLEDMGQMRQAVDRARAQLAQLEFERAFRAPMASRTRNAAQPLRYSGTVGCSDVDVRGVGAVNVTVSQEGDEIVITTGDATVRVKAGAKK